MRSFTRSIPLLVAAFALLGVLAAPQQAMANDCNADGSFDISDVVFLLNYLFVMGPTPPILANCNCNGGGVDISDAICMLVILF
ncbi:MAG: hypothetical protein ACE5GW_02680 [Planctomycetota bacterium]